MKIYSKNKKVKYDYNLLDKYQAGISLFGTEVKSIKNGDVDLTGSYIVIDKNMNAQWLNGNISKYKFQTQGSHEPRRTRQLLLKKREIKKILDKVNQQKLTIVPYILYADYKSNLKLEIYLAKGKSNQDKREAIKARDSERESSKYYN